MLKVLLVDDEPYILKGLAAIIDWQAEGFEIVGTASNGIEALRLIRTEEPNLVITDIKMPEMNGLDLLKNTRAEGFNDPNFIFLTGYDDFEFVRTALKYNTMEYLLKPVEQKELLIAIGKARAIQTAWLQKKHTDSQREKEAFSRKLISLLRGKADVETLETVKAYLGEIKNIRYISVELDNHSDAIELASDEEKRRMQKLVYSSCIFITNENFRCIYDASIRPGNYDVGLICDDETDIDDLKTAIKKEIDFPIRFVVGKKVDSLENLDKSYKSALISAYMQSYEITAENGSQASIEKEVTWTNKSEIDELIHAVETNACKDIENMAVETYMMILDLEPRVMSMIINYILFELLQLARKVDENVNQAEVLQYISAEAFDDMYLNGDKESFTKMLTDYAEYLSELRSNQSGGVLANVEADIKENYADNLTLKDLSQKYYINAAYLGQLFRNKYGISFKDYLHKVRIEEAEKLLINTELKVFEVAEKVGYKDMDYFINHFISEKGCTPTKFRKQIRN